jgi:Glycosyltransferase family 92
MGPARPLLKLKLWCLLLALPFSSRKSDWSAGAEDAGWSFPRHHRPGGKQSKARITACCMVKNELPYVIEWIEFHYLMGFSKMVIYDDSSTDGTALLGRLYEQVGWPSIASKSIHNIRHTCLVSCP